MKEMDISTMDSFLIGQAEDASGQTGCTVILSPEGAVAGVDVRGGAPGTKETDVLRSENLVEQIHGVFLSGGSAYGLDVGSGVMRFLEEKNIGFDVNVAKVPIVPGAILFDLKDEKGMIRPNAEMGYQAAENAWRKTAFKSGSFGAGAGATIGKVLGPSCSMKGGIGHWACRAGEVEVGAVIAVNCFGDIFDPEEGTIIAGLHDKGVFLHTESYLLKHISDVQTNRFSGNTTIGAIMTNAKLSKSQANKLAGICHDGLARTIRPSHLFVDGDTLFTLSENKVSCDLNALASLAATAVEKAVVNAVKSAASTGKPMAFKDFPKKR
ncbi:P1 family peptidase [Halobacillus litoralis]|uniref:P1 family peptidase n=1 Tax=Halobacillus litoralis TaxID=45668 RepID=UPI001CFE63F3|nr:P1 family peptidase [Halobacillus litoralis]